LGVVRKSVEKIQVLLKSDMNNGYLKAYEHFTVVSCWILLRIWNISCECWENQNTHFKTVLFMR